MVWEQLKVTEEAHRCIIGTDHPSEVLPVQCLLQNVCCTLSNGCFTVKNKVLNNKQFTYSGLHFQ